MPCHLPGLASRVGSRYSILDTDYFWMPKYINKYILLVEGTCTVSGVCYKKHHHCVSKRENRKGRKMQQKNQTASWTSQSIVKFKCFIQRPDTTIDDIKEFLTGLIELVSTFISAHVICSSPSQSCPFLLDMLCLSSKNKAERFFFERMVLPALRTAHLPSGDQYIREGMKGM